MNIIKKILYLMFSLLITSIILVKCLDPMTGSGIDLNPFIAILYFALSVYLIIKGHWEYDYSEDPHHPTRVWVKEKYHDRIYDTIPAHEECTRCGYGSR